MSKRLLATLTLVCLSLTGCGYQGHYRYPCQDPANWETADCKPPVCEVLGTCPEDIVGEDIVNPPTDATTTDGTNNG
jgi:predicted small lipoprotein YifL